MPARPGTAAARPGTVAYAIAAVNADPKLIAEFAALASHYATAGTVAGARTAAQLRATKSHYGIRSALAFDPGTECPECGALPGFVHPAGCATNRYPHLGTERPEITAAIETSVHA